MTLWCLTISIALNISKLAVIDALESGNSCSCPLLSIIRKATNFERVPKYLPKNDFIIFPHWNSLSSSLKSLANKATKSTARTKQFILQPEHSCHFELTSFRLNQIKLWILPSRHWCLAPLISVCRYFIFYVLCSDRFIPATVQFNSQCRRRASMNILQRLCKSCSTPHTRSALVVIRKSNRHKEKWSS